MIAPPVAEWQKIGMTALPDNWLTRAGRSFVFFFSLVLLATSCSKSKQATSRKAEEPIRNIDACTLLTSEELQSAQGEALQQTVPSTPAAPAFTISQCYFNMPTNTNSVVITVAQRGSGAGAKDPREFFEETFHQAEGRGEKEAGERGEEKEKHNPPQKIDGLGDEAFWAASPVGGALYILKGNMYLRISTGGANQLERTKRLAEIALAKL
ncbi:MAG TPA: hypothetical protein VGC85_05145 [Chthoniobacterales bacterium]